MRLLLVEDSRQVAEVIYEYFEQQGYVLDHGATGPLGLKLAQEHKFDCIILDIMLPGLDGISLCQQLREKGITTPVIMLTARDTHEDILLGLQTGADDYVVKPFDLELLEARIQAVTRRSSNLAFSYDYQIGELCLNHHTREVTRSGKVINLTPSGFKILKLLVEQFPAAVSRSEIEYLLWADDGPDQDVLRKHIYQLRSKLDKPFIGEMIVTVPKLGYKLVCPE